MAIIKHLSSKSSDYSAVLDYLMFQHDEKTGKELLDENGRRLLRTEFYLDGINCEVLTFDLECKQFNDQFHKNQNRSDVKSHHYIISFDPRDAEECGLDGKRAQAIGVEFANRFFAGHQMLVCTHMDGNNKSGNIHVHIVLNSLRKLDVEPQPFMERSHDSRAGYKHHQTRELLTAMQKGLMEITEREGLHQIDLLSPAAVKITEKEYRKEQRGQEKLEELNTRIIADGLKPRFNKFQTELQRLRDAINDVSASACSFEELQNGLREKYRITLKESRDRFSYLLPDRERYITARRLGADFEKNHLLAVLEKNKKSLTFDPGYDYESDPVAILFIRSDLHLVTDLQTCVKAQQNAAYARKVKLTNLKEMAKTVCYIQENGFDTRDDLKSKLEEIRSKLQEAQQTFHNTEDRIRTLNEQIHYVGQYKSNKAVKAEFLKAKNKTRFREQHGDELDLYETAVKYIKENMNAVVPSLKGLKQERNQLLQRKEAQRGTCKYFQEYEKKLWTVCTNVDAILDGTTAHVHQALESEQLDNDLSGKASLLNRLHEKQQVVGTQKLRSQGRRKADVER